jgi:hypothetical protein
MKSLSISSHCQRQNEARGYFKNLPQPLFNKEGSTKLAEEDCNR